MPARPKDFRINSLIVRKMLAGIHVDGRAYDSTLEIASLGVDQSYADLPYRHM